MDRLIQRLEQRAAPLLRDVGIVAAMLLTNGFYHCEGRYLPGYIDLVRMAFGLLLVFTLLSFGFWNGVLKRAGFVLSVSMLLILPQIGRLLLVGQSTVKGLGRLLYDLSVLFGDWPFAALGSALHLSTPPTAFLCLFLSLAAFCCGVFLRQRSSKANSRAQADIEKSSFPTV